MNLAEQTSVQFRGPVSAESFQGDLALTEMLHQCKLDVKHSSVSSHEFTS